MADISIITGSLSGDPQFVESDKGSFWKFSIPESKKNNATVWYNFTYSAPATHPVLSRCKKGSSVVVTSKSPYTLNEYSFGAFDPKKNSASVQRDVLDITFGSYDKKPKAEEEGDSPDDFYPAAKQDPLVPPTGADEGFSIPQAEKRPDALKF